MTDGSSEFRPTFPTENEGENIEHRGLDIEESNDSIARKIPDFNIVRFNVPVKNGDWEGESGDSNWNPDPESVPQRYNPEEKTWGEILDEHEIEGIPFEDDTPDFSEVSKDSVEIDDFSEKRSENFPQADEELANKWDCFPEEVAQWRQENGYTWHECEDCKTMQLVPKEIHNNIPHSGGISEIKNQKADNGESNNE